MAVTLENLKIYLKITDDTEDDLLSLFLSMAENKVLNKRYPYGYTDEEKTAAIEKYSDVVMDIAVFLYNKQGAEGQTGHSENGISRSYEKAGIPDSFIQDIIPVAKLM
jgi:hypothetical protein